MVSQTTPSRKDLDYCLVRRNGCSGGFGTTFTTAVPPIHSRQEKTLIHASAMLNRYVDQRIKEGFREQVRLQAKLGQFCVLGVVIVLLRLHRGSGR